MRKINFFILISALFFTGFVQINDPVRKTSFSADEMKKHVYYLASEKLEGRFTGSPGCLLAAEYISSYFKTAGLEPAFGNGYSQAFTFTAGVEAGQNNSLSFSYGSDKYDLTFQEDFISAPFSGSANVEGELIFAGYGISAPKLNYDDYDNLDVTGKIVLLMRYHPEYDNPHSQFDEYASFRYKATIARDKGALGVIFVNGHMPKDEDDKLIPFKYDRGAPIKDFPVAHVKRNTIDKLFESTGKNFSSVQAEISESKTPGSFLFKNTRVKLSADVNEIQKETWNIAGLIEGSDPDLKNEYIVIGAHYDHLGYGETGSLYRGTEPKIHYGADDNASGTTMMMMLASHFASIKNDLKRSLLFIGFSGEELGLLGSAYFVAHSPVPVKNIAAMINLDMVGRLNDENSLVAYGTGTSPIFTELLEQKNSYDLKLSFVEDGFGPSDHSSFYAKEIPVLFFFTGTHTDYHRPSDTADKVNYDGMVKIASFTSDVIAELNQKPDKPEYVLVPRKDGGTMGGWKVYVGTIPDYSGNEEGFKISGVNEGSPAQKGGMLAGDIMIKFGAKKITNIYDYVYALREYVPGDKVDVIVKRNGEEVTLSIELGAR